MANVTGLPAEYLELRDAMLAAYWLAGAWRRRDPWGLGMMDRVLGGLVHDGNLEAAERRYLEVAAVYAARLRAAWLACYRERLGHEA